MRTVVIFIVVITAVLCMFEAARWALRLRRSILVIAAASGVAAYVLFLFARTGGWMVGNLIVLLVAAIAGCGLGLLLTTRPALISFCLAAAIVDVFSVSGGISSKLSATYREGSSDLLQYLAISIPSAGQPQPIIGISDLAITAALYFALMKLRHRGTLLFFAPLAGLLAAVVVGLMVGGVFAIPFLAVTTIAYALAVPEPPPTDSLPKSSG